MRPLEAQSGPPAPPALFDAGWLFLIAGLAVLVATVLIPAAEDLHQAQYLRDRAVLIEEHRQARLERYEQFLGALRDHEPSLVMALAQSQLNQIPADRVPILPVSDSARVNQANASVFPALEPPPLHLRERRLIDSTLQRWATGDTSRLWLIAGGAVCVLVGLLPKARP